MKVKLKVISMLLVAFGMVFAGGGQSLAQVKTISGTVSDDSGALLGVSIIIKGTSTGTETDFNGKYSIKAKTGDVLSFSYVGYITIERTVGVSNAINVILVEDDDVLDEVVVVAYGAQTKESIVGSVAVVSAEIIEKQQSVSILTAIQGSVPGVSIISSGGQPGDNPTIRIRGIGSINASAAPLIILDGTPFNGNLNSISADQVKSINVLKDASSTALYGSRGANGVIVIVTKKGNLNSPLQFNFKSSIGFANQAVKPHELIGVDDLFRYSWEALKNKFQYIDELSASVSSTNATNGLITGWGYNPYGPSVPKPVDVSGKLVTSNKLWETDWRDLLFNRQAIRTEHGLSGSGGGNRTSYFFSLDYLKQEGSITKSDFERITSRINVNSKVNKWIEVGVNTSFSTTKQSYPTQSGNSFQAATQWTTALSSVFPLYRRDGQGDIILDDNGNKIFDYGVGATGQTVNTNRGVFSNENAYGALFNYVIERNRDSFTGTAFVKFNITEDLDFKTTLGYEKYFFDGFEYVHNEFGFASNVGGRVSQDRNKVTTINFIKSLNYTKSFDNHNINGTIIHESYEGKFDFLSAQGVGFLPGVKVLSGSTTPEGVGGSTNLDRLESYLGRIAYNYDNKYFIEGSYRRDGSTRFSKEVRNGDFYSVGASWILSNERFLEGNETLSYLKLKGSYGELGNNDTPSFFPYLNSFDTGWNNLDQTGVLLTSNNDPNLTWEKTASLNIGVEFGFLDSRITGGIDYYNRESIDLIYSRPVPGSTGNTTFTTNVGAIKNYGLEISLITKNIITDNFQWTTNFNISLDKSEITELTQESFIRGSKRWKVGTSLYEFFIREYAGVDEENGKALWYKDVLDGDDEPTGEKKTTNNYSEATRYQTGKQSLPDFQGGLTNNFILGNFDINILLNYSFGGWIYDSTYASLMGGFERFGAAASPDIVGRWQKPGDETNIPRLLNSSNAYNAQSDRFLFKNNYVRLKALNFGYNLPPKYIKKYGINKVRLYFQGDNLLTYQSHKGIDPEQNLAGTTNSRSYNQRIYSFGLKLEL